MRNKNNKKNNYILLSFTVFGENMQLFKEPVPNRLLKDFLELNALVTTSTTNGDIAKTKYTFTKTHYKKCVFNKTVDPFLLSIKHYYFSAKEYFVTRRMTYLHFLTVLRQLCAHQQGTYMTDMQYDKSSYEIVYHYFLNGTAAPEL